MDPAGILMLRSVRIVFELLGLQPESIKFKKEEFNSSNLVKALNDEPKRCPVIETTDRGGDNVHIMVAAYALKGSEIINESGPNADLMREEWFIYCKNSYRDDPDEPGIVLKTHLYKSYMLNFGN